MIIALNNSADADIILSSLRAGIHEYLYPPLQDALRRSLEKRAAERSRRREGAKGDGKSFGFFSAKGGCGATTLVCHVAAELGRTIRRCCWPIWIWTRHGRVHHQDQGGLLDSGRSKQSAPPGHLLLEGAGFERYSRCRDCFLADRPGL